jgi:hypothetical protein
MRTCYQENRTDAINPKLSGAIASHARAREKSPEKCEVIAQGNDRLEDIALDRAIAGSDELLMFLLRGRRPEKYRRDSGRAV